MIVDFSQSHLRARTVGLYYLIQNLAVTPAAAIGGLLWNIAPETPFIISGIVGAVGVAVFIASVEEKYPLLRKILCYNHDVLSQTGSFEDRLPN